MNKKLFFTLLLICSQMPPALFATANCTDGACSTCPCTALSQSFFSIRPVFTILSPEYLAHSRDYYKKYSTGCGGTVQLTALGGKSTRNDNLAHFFLPTCKTTLNVNEQQLTGTDVLASNLNIYTVDGTFQSTVEFKPLHSYAGLGINYQQRFYEDCSGNGFWFSISGPILRVHNRIELIETITNNGGGALSSPALTPPTAGCPTDCPNPCNTDCIVDPLQALPPVDSVVAAFAQPGWCFGRIDNTGMESHKKTGVGDITVRLGYEVVNREDAYLDWFFGFIAPTGNTPKAIQVFEPIIGHNHHWGIVLGSSFSLEIWQSECSDTTVRWNFDGAITDLFKRNERRSFDLLGKPWSRYMQFYSSLGQAMAASTSIVPTYALILHTPGIDILTQDVSVKPGFYRMLNSALVIDHRCFELEVGYNFFARQAECIKLGSCPFPTGVALKAINAGSGETGTFQTINNNFGDNCLGSAFANYDDNIITVADLDLQSAAHPATLTHTVYGSVAYNFEGCACYPMFIAAGGSYEFSPDDVGLNRWMAWGKVGIAF